MPMRVAGVHQRHAIMIAFLVPTAQIFMLQVRLAKIIENRDTFLVRCGARSGRRRFLEQIFSKPSLFVAPGDKFVIIANIPFGLLWLDMDYP